MAPAGARVIESPLPMPLRLASALLCLLLTAPAGAQDAERRRGRTDVPPARTMPPGMPPRRPKRPKPPPRPTRPHSPPPEAPLPPPPLPDVPDTDETPLILRWMIRPLKRGMFIRLPIMDTDPNRGITYGVMPIVVLQGKTDDRIEQIHAPSLTYNRNFVVTPTYRYYYYPQDDASFVGRTSIGKFEHEVMGQYEDHGVLGTSYDVYLRVQKNRDAGQRFFGVGADTPRAAEANYVQDFWLYRWAVGSPIRGSKSLRARVSQRYMTSRVLNGPIPGLPTFQTSFPGQASERAQQVTETRASLEHDTRDHGVTTSRGTYALAYAESSVRGFLSQYDFQRYGADARWFKPWPGDPGKVFAVQAAYEQMTGPGGPFWVMPSLGGKYSLRAYGDGRYVDRGAATVNVEQRFKVFEAKTAGVTTELQLAPFVGAGTAFSGPGAASSKRLRPVVGGAVRAVAKPQVVGSVDFGVGREGLSVFMDINYSF